MTKTNDKNRNSRDCSDPDVAIKAYEDLIELLRLFLTTISDVMMSWLSIDDAVNLPRQPIALWFDDVSFNLLIN